MANKLFAGEAVEPRAFPGITREQLKRYAEASGDPNPIHLDDEAAKRVGLPGVIAHGMLSAAMLAERAERFIRQERGFAQARLVEFQTRFKAKVFPGDALVIGGVVKEAGEAVVLELQARNAKGEVTTTAVARYSLI